MSTPTLLIMNPTGTYHRNYIQTFDAYEAMLIGVVYDSVSNSINGSAITDSYAATLAKERADRVIAKLPDGVTEPIGQADVGKAMFMDLMRQKWVYPNANAQHPLLEKLQHVAALLQRLRLYADVLRLECIEYRLRRP
jgi:hypothetical protein